MEEFKLLEARETEAIIVLLNPEHNIQNEITASFNQVKVCLCMYVRGEAQRRVGQRASAALYP